MERRSSDSSLESSYESYYEYSRSRMGPGVLPNRFLALAVLTALIIVSIVFQTELNGLKVDIKNEKQKVQAMERTIERHEMIIQRFNTSVTNSDVLSQLNQLKDSMATHEDELRNDLASVKADISAQLQDTLSQLGETVTQAEAEIQDEVDKVKKDVESYVRTTQDQFSMENSFMVYQLAGTFTLLSCLISMWHMTAHLRRFNQPIVQRKILAILWMCPIYAVTSWFSLVFHAAEGYLAVIKDFYEAYIIYQFLSFCIAVLGRGDRSAVVHLLAKHADHLSPPIRFDYLCNRNPYGSDTALADAVLLQCQGFAMQFVFLRPLTTIALFVLEKMNYYGPTGNQMDYRSPQFYLIGIQNLSVFIAFTGLLKFYHAVDKELSWCRPFAKFLCIKGVVFMTFWQGLAIDLLANTTDVAGQDQEEWARAAQNFLICLEMLLFSIAHFYTFPTEEWMDGYRATHKNSQFGDSIALGDFVSDLKLLLRSNKKKRKKKKKKSSVDKLPTITDGAHYDEDETVYSTISYTQSESDEINVEAIQAALHEFDGSDPEMCKVKMRLLSSRLLSPDFVDEDHVISGDSEPHSPVHDNENKVEVTTGAAADDSVTTPETGVTFAEDEIGDPESALPVEGGDEGHIAGIVEDEPTDESAQNVAPPPAVDGPEAVGGDQVVDEENLLETAAEGVAASADDFDGEISEVGTDDDEPPRAMEEDEPFRVLDEEEAPPMGLYSGGASGTNTPPEEQPTETTELLVGDSPLLANRETNQQSHTAVPDNMLRPSIFTQISTIQPPPSNEGEETQENTEPDE